MKVCSETTPGSVNFSFYQPRGVTGLFVMNHDESNPSLCTSLSTVRDFFFFARLCLFNVKFQTILLSIPFTSKEGICYMNPLPHMLRKEFQ